LLCCGTFLNGCAIISSTFQEDTMLGEYALGDEDLNLNCMANLWLVALGSAVTLSALFAQQSSLMNKTQSNGLGPFGLLVGTNVAILSVWSILAPNTWDRPLDLGEELGPYRGSCYNWESDDALIYKAKMVFAFLLAAVNIASLLATNYNCYQARNLVRLPIVFLKLLVSQSSHPLLLRLDHSKHSQPSSTSRITWD
jgi:hypothetical protein